MNVEAATAANNGEEKKRSAGESVAADASNDIKKENEKTKGPAPPPPSAKTNEAAVARSEESALQQGNKENVDSVDRHRDENKQLNERRRSASSPQGQHQKRPAPRPPSMNLEATPVCKGHEIADNNNLAETKNAANNRTTSAEQASCDLSSPKLVQLQNRENQLQNEPSAISSDNQLSNDLHNSYHSSPTVPEDSNTVKVCSKNSSDKNVEHLIDTKNASPTNSLSEEVTICRDYSTIIADEETDRTADVDTSHVSIVTIEDNGKEVIQTTKEYYEKTTFVDNPSANSLLPSKDEVLIIHNDPKNDVIVVSNDYVPNHSSPATKKNPSQRVEIVPESSSSNQDTDDQLSIRTSSSDSSSRQGTGSRKKVPVNLNLIEDVEATSRHNQHNKNHATSTKTTAGGKDDDDVRRTRVDQVPSKNKTSSTCAPQDDTHHRTTSAKSSPKRTVPNGIAPATNHKVPTQQTNSTNKQPSTIVNNNNNANSNSNSNNVALRRELSDAGSCGSFLSANSDKENLSIGSQTGKGAKADKAQQVVMRRKVVYRLWILCLCIKHKAIGGIA